MTTQSPPDEAREAVEEVCGTGVDLELISDRRGSAVYRATSPKRSAAVKIGAGPEGFAITSREAEALSAMAAEGALLAHGQGRRAAWMVTPWYEGPSTWEALANVRYGDGSLDAALSRVVELCEAVAQLHQADWVHGDLQPGHAIHTDRGVALIDCSWAWHPEKLFPSMLFRGGMPHLLAPELAASVEAGQRPVTPSRSAEVYTLATSLWWAISGTWPLDYEAAGIDPTKLMAAQLRRAIGSGRLKPRAATTWPTVQDVLAAVITEPPERRPTANELASQLRSSGLCEEHR
ncbi:hypothetical protein ACWCPK_02665 [Streptomyces sp. NPDC001953]